MDLELSDEQTWLAESVQTLLAREWSPAADAPYGDEAQRDRLWRALVDFGALTVGGDDGLGAVELCLIARALGAHLAPVPYLGSAALRFAVRAARRWRRRRRTGAARTGIELGKHSAAHHDRPDTGRRRPQRAQGGRRARAGGRSGSPWRSAGPTAWELAVIAPARPASP